jgi:hypothetical protein
MIVSLVTGVLSCVVFGRIFRTQVTSLKNEMGRNVSLLITLFTIVTLTLTTAPIRRRGAMIKPHSSPTVIILGGDGDHIYYGGAVGQYRSHERGGLT